MSPETNKHILKYLPMPHGTQCKGEEGRNGKTRTVEKNGSLGAP